MTHLFASGMGEEAYGIAALLLLATLGFIFLTAALGVFRRSLPAAMLSLLATLSLGTLIMICGSGSLQEPPPRLSPAQAEAELEKDWYWEDPHDVAVRARSNFKGFMTLWLLPLAAAAASFWIAARPGARRRAAEAPDSPP